MSDFDLSQRFQYPAAKPAAMHAPVSLPAPASAPVFAYAQSQPQQQTALRFAQMPAVHNLQGFVEVPQRDWLNLPVGSHIKFESDKGLMPGGYVKSVDKMNKQLVLSSGRNFAESKEFRLGLAKAKKIYRENTSSAATATSAAVPVATVSSTHTLEMRVKNLEETVKILVDVLTAAAPGYMAGYHARKAT